MRYSQTNGLIYLLLIGCMAFGNKLSAQVIDKKDSIRSVDKSDSLNIDEADSLNILQKVDQYSKKTEFGRALGKLVFKNNVSNKGIKISLRNRDSQKSYAEDEGKIIRNIYIETLDPFGNSVTDTIKKKINYLERTGNKLHVTTRKNVIRSLLLFKKNQALDSLKLRESERLIRSQRYIRKVAFRTESDKESRDSVDVYIRALDSWSVYITSDFSGSKIGLKLVERNFLGTGHNFEAYTRQNLRKGKNGHRLIYTVPNIRRTYINATVSYINDEDNNYSRGINIGRNFFSPLTRWAGGAYIGQQSYKDSLVNGLKQSANFKLKYNIQDFWLGYAYPIFKGENNKVTNIITSARVYNRHYLEQPPQEFDSLAIFSNKRIYLLGIGISTRSYVQDSYLFNHGTVEDVPVGALFGINAGIEQKNSKKRFYLGGRLSAGNYTNYGFLGANLQYGIFFRGKNTEQSVLSLETIYFTSLKNWGTWKFRHLAKTNLIIGGNRLKHEKDQLTLNENDYAGIDGFKSKNLFGTKKLLLSFQTQSYSPWSILGFRISPFANVTFGFLAPKNKFVLSSDIYSRFGVGVLLTNDYLVFSNIQFSFSYYPTIPGQGRNITEMNSYDNQDFGMMKFEFGRPSTVEYNRYQ